MSSATFNQHAVSPDTVAFTESGEPVSPTHAYAALVATPTTWDKPEPIGPSVVWSGGEPLRHWVGPSEQAGLWARSRLVGAGPGFAYAHVLGLRIGPLFASRLTVICAEGIASTQIEGGAEGQPFTPGSRITIEHLQVEVGVTEQHEDGSTTTAGLKIVTPAGPVIYIAVARAGRPTPYGPGLT